MENLQYTLPKEKTNIQEIIQTLEEHSVYDVWVSFNKQNSIHRAILLTGFKTGSYSKLVLQSYEKEYSIYDAYFLNPISLLTTNL